MEEKLAIIVSGGGMKSVFGVGVLLALAEKHKITDPSLLICGSGNAGTGSYYISKQYDSIRNIWLNLVSSKKFLNRKRFWKIIDIDYLVDEIFKKQDRLKEEFVYNSKTRYLISAFNKDTGLVDYFDNFDKTDIFESMRAAKAMPIAFKPNPKIKVNNSYYCDSMFSSDGFAHIKKAVELGAKKILIINNNPCKRRGIDDFLFYTWMLFQKNRKNYYKHQKEILNFKHPEDVKIFTINPKSKIKSSILNNNRDLLKKTMEQGYEEAIFDDNLKSFLN